MTQRLEVLPMFNVGQQKHVHGGVSASYVKASSTGKPDATVALARQLVEALQGRPDERAYQSDLEKLQPAPLSEAIRERLVGLPELVDPGLDAAELRRRHALLLLLRAKAGSRVAHDAMKVATHYLEDLRKALQAGLMSGYAARPDRARVLADQSRRVLGEITFPPVQADSFVQLQRALAILDQLQARRGQLMPTSLEAITTQLVAKAHEAYGRALAATAAELAETAFRGEFSALESLCDELIGRGAEFQRKLQAWHKELVARQKTAAQDQHVSRASVVMPLPGPDEKQVLAGMIVQAHCADIAQLSIRLLDVWEAGLRRLAIEHCPYLDANKAPLADLVRGLSARHLADAFDQAVEEGLGGGHTLYELMNKEGIDEVAKFLFDRAEPTIDLGERDIETFNVSPERLTIVRLPPPSGPRDPAIRDQLIAALNRRGPCIITEGAATDRTATTVRVLLGFPIGIETNNRAFLDRYLRSGARGHLPHLLGVLPESPLGTYVPRMELLAGATPAPVEECHDHV